jgi:hypothetical protein
VHVDVSQLMHVDVNQADGSTLDSPSTVSLGLLEYPLHVSLERFMSAWVHDTLAVKHTIRDSTTALMHSKISSVHEFVSYVFTQNVES